MKIRRAVLGILMIAALLPVLGSGILEAGPQVSADPPPAQASLDQPPAESGAATRPPKEKMEIAVLLAWVWLSIAVLVWILRQKVREADRLSRMGLCRPTGHDPEGPRE